MSDIKWKKCCVCVQEMSPCSCSAICIQAAALPDSAISGTTTRDSLYGPVDNKRAPTPQWCLLRRLSERNANKGLLPPSLNPNRLVLFSQKSNLPNEILSICRLPLLPHFQFLTLTTAALESNHIPVIYSEVLQAPGK
jgi:hypothetical protein